ncbi:MAG: GNAT family N-acetyltransferase [Xanthomonadaceae bacterium]|nr:GNAT family N-acetyltransferase [Xanthomonadaceae bacterium]
MVIVPLQPKLHDRQGFTCGIASLDTYLKQQASQHQRDGIATTHVLADEDAPTRILGYVTLAAAQVELDALQPADRKRLPHYPVPAVRMGRLAVATSEHGQGYGQWLLGHAVNVSLRLRQQLGVRVLLVDALDAKVAKFYRAFGFRPTATQALTLYLPIGSHRNEK